MIFYAPANRPSRDAPTDRASGRTFFGLDRRHRIPCVTVRFPRMRFPSARPGRLDTHVDWAIDRWSNPRPGDTDETKVRNPEVFRRMGSPHPRVSTPGRPPPAACRRASVTYRAHSCRINAPFRFGEIPAVRARSTALTSIPFGRSDENRCRTHVSRGLIFEGLLRPAPSAPPRPGRLRKEP